MLVHEFLENSAAMYPDAHAVWYKDEWKTYAEINEMSEKAAFFLQERGLKRGERVAILYENSFEYVSAYYGILKSGGVTVALNTETDEKSLRYCLAHSDARFLITNSRYFSLLEKIKPDFPDLTVIAGITGKNRDTDFRDYFPLDKVFSLKYNKRRRIRCINIDLASIVYTSGSTGEPKGVTLTHLNIVTNTRSIVSYLKLTKEDRIMVVLPFYYIYGKSLLNTHFMTGGSVVIDNRFSYPQVVLNTMKDTEVTGFAGVPSTFMILLNNSAVRKFSFRKLRYLTQAGGAMAPSVQKEVTEVFTSSDLFIMYGATEASARLSYLEPAELKDKMGSIGKAIPNVDLFVADDEGNSLEVMQKGEIVARGANIMQGYWKDPEGTAEVLRHGLYYTGDIGYEDEDGYIFVVGRSKDIIKPGGMRVSAREVEERILENPLVFECAVIGVEDDVLGEAIKSFIVLKKEDTATEDDIRKFLADKLPSYKIPKYSEFIAELPKNQSGKIMKNILKERERNES